MINDRKNAIENVSGEVEGKGWNRFAEMEG